MRVRMISDPMAADPNFPDEFRTGPYKFSDQEKCPTHGVAIKKRKKTRRNGRVRTIVESKSDFPRGIRVPRRRAKQFRRGSHGTPSDKSRSGRYRTTRRDGWPWIQTISPYFIFARPRVACQTSGRALSSWPSPCAEAAGRHGPAEFPPSFTRTGSLTPLPRSGILHIVFRLNVSRA